MTGIIRFGALGLIAAIMTVTGCTMFVSPYPLNSAYPNNTAYPNPVYPETHHHHSSGGKDKDKNKDGPTQPPRQPPITVNCGHVYCGDGYYSDTIGGPGPTGGYHIVRRRETLNSIARYYYGDSSQWRVIYDYNREIIRCPDCIYVGQELYIP